MKRLILCCDGTWNTVEQERNGRPCPTNVVKLAYRISKRAPDGTPQVVYYSQGVGTGNLVDRITGGAFGEGLTTNLHEAYLFLVGNYEQGDEIYLFGFSRGAFTARSIGGMIRKCGILDRSHVDRYVEALALYQDTDVHPNDAKAVQFRAETSVGADTPIPIKCIGVWDTVGALGIPWTALSPISHKRFAFHDTELSGQVENGFHALAIDEQRAPFAPTLWDEKAKEGQRIVQTWFIGAHGDVGGGYVNSSLSDISLRWMIEHVEPLGLALMHSTEYRAAVGLRDDPLGPLHNSRKGFYLLTKKIDRAVKIGGTQAIHPTVIDRWKNDKTYRPSNLQQIMPQLLKDAEAGA